MKIALIDDEEYWRKMTYEQLELFFKADQMHIFTSGEEFLEKSEVFDIVFLDIEMPGMDGFETAQKYKNIHQEGIVMILTTHTEMARRGYQVNAFRYIDKSNMAEEFEEAIPSALNLLKKNQKIEIPIVGLGNMEFQLKEIIYIETEKRNICIHTIDNQFYSNMDMQTIVEKLGKAFYRCHRSYIVNLDMVEKLERTGLLLKNGSEVLLSAKKRTEFKQQYLNWRYEFANA